MAAAVPRLDFGELNAVRVPWKAYKTVFIYSQPHNQRIRTLLGEYPTPEVAGAAVEQAFNGTAGGTWRQEVGNPPLSRVSYIYDFLMDIRPPGFGEVEQFAKNPQEIPAWHGAYVPPAGNDTERDHAAYEDMGSDTEEAADMSQPAPQMGY